jgi:hypothetical protein
VWVPDRVSFRVGQEKQGNGLHSRCSAHVAAQQHGVAIPIQAHSAGKPPYAYLPAVALHAYASHTGTLRSVCLTPACCLAVISTRQSLNQDGLHYLGSLRTTSERCGRTPAGCCLPNTGCSKENDSQASQLRCCAEVGTTHDIGWPICTLAVLCCQAIRPVRA